MKLVLEALFRLYYEAMVKWHQQRKKSQIDLENLNKLVHDIQHAFEAGDRASARQLTESLEMEFYQQFEALKSEFQEAGRSESATSAYWDTFMQGVDTLLKLLRAERASLLELHLQAVCEVIPWCRAADRNNYAKYLPIYLSDMRTLQEKHPKSYQYLRDGGFSVRRSTQQFHSVPSDQALEQTINREGKSRGGVIGFTLRKGALTRWLLTRHVTAQYSEAMKVLCDTNQTPTQAHTEHGATRMTRDEDDVVRILEYVSNSQNPFDLDTVPQELVNIATGQVASQEVAKGLSQFLEDAQKRNNAFLERRLLNDRTISFWDTDSRSKTPTFASMSKSLKVHNVDRNLIDSEVLFRRLLAVSKQRDVSLEHVLTHELAALPPSLFNEDGTMRKTNKADLAKKLESHCPEIHVPLTENQSRTAYIIDGMAYFQALDEKHFNTFNDLGCRVFQKIRTLLTSDLAIDSVTIVFDRYDGLHSIKQMERARRAAGETTPCYVVQGSNKVPNYRKFLRNNTNKSNLAEFISHYIMLNGPPALGQDQSIVLACGFKEGKDVKVVQHNGVSDIPELFSTKEEADTRIVLHAVELAKKYSRIIVRCDDTDVLVLLVHYCGKGMFDESSIYMHAGHSSKVTNHQRFIPVSNITAKVGEKVSRCLPAAHAISGCDSTSSLFKIGKRTAYVKLEQNIDDLLPLSELGQSNDISEVLPTTVKYALLLYGVKGKSCDSLDQLRYAYACTSDKTASLFPPTDDAFSQHVRRANYQVAIWTNSHIAQPVLWHPDGNGWVTDCEHKLQPIYYEKEAALKEVRDLTHQYCTDESCTLSKRCQCVSVGLQCTDFCSCNTEECPNADSSRVLEEDSDDSSD